VKHLGLAACLAVAACTPSHAYSARQPQPSPSDTSGSASGGEITCPEISGAVDPTSTAPTEILARLRAAGQPVQPGNLEVQAAQNFDIAPGLSKRCGRDSIRLSRWVHVCTRDQTHCSVAHDSAPGLAADYLMLKIGAAWHAWYWLPGGDPNPVP
jgi:hypothetical protein